MNPAEDYILKQTEPYRSILMHVQSTIELTIPDAELKYKWRLPCYYIGKRPMCYLNKSKDYIDVGFWHSAYLQKYTEHLVSDNRKIVKSLRYKTLKEIDDRVLVQILQEVYLFRDKSFWK